MINLKHASWVSSDVVTLVTLVLRSAGSMPASAHLSQPPCSPSVQGKQSADMEEADL